MEQENIIQINPNPQDYTLDVIIPVYHPDKKLQKLLTMLSKQRKKPNRIIILHTIEKEERIELPELQEIELTVLPINKQDFDHGGTRKYGASQSSADVLMFMTQDAIPVDEYLTEKLLEPYQNPSVAATYARQIPAEDSDILEFYTRLFNYPKKSRIKSSDDINELGIKTFFCSNVCATYRNEVYLKLGGFVDKTIFNEDMILAFGMIGSGYKIAYQAEAKVIHSHKYSYLQQFTRNFDLGVSHKQYEELFSSVKSETEGIKLVKQTLNHLIKQKEYLLIPDLILNSGFKFLGYRFGLNYHKLPKNMVFQFSMNKSYWN